MKIYFIKATKIMLPFLLVILSGVVSAGQTSCDVKVTSLYVEDDGLVTIKTNSRNDWTTICSLSSERMGVGTTTCAMWLSMIRGFEKNSELFRIRYQTDGFTCSDMATYGSSPVPRYVMDL